MHNGYNLDVDDRLTFWRDGELIAHALAFCVSLIFFLPPFRSLQLRDSPILVPSRNWPFLS